VVRAIAAFDEILFRGEWRLLAALPEMAFMLSDAPVVAWQRLESGQISYGVGFHTPNVEVFLPMSPATCLHILPKVRRSREIASPTIAEINIAQAAFAYNACFAKSE
jgi:hypothetical protein